MKPIKSQFEKDFQSRRTIIFDTNPNKQKFNQITVYVGLYNAIEYLDSLLESIKLQTHREFKLVLADNHSTDGTWEKVLSWQELLPNEVILIRNPCNVGGTANLQMNLDLINTDWFCAFHQDDIYLENHVETLVKGIVASTQDQIMISTEMLSIDESGKKLPLKPRSAWLISEMTKEEQFVANLFTHSIYWPCTAFKTAPFKKIEVPWHSAAFPDTEILLRLLSFGRSLQMPNPTMYYRENTKSMSHYLDQEEVTFGAAISLIRVFSSEEFRSLVESQEKETFEEFSKGVLSGLNIRLKNSQDLARLVTLYALEMINIARGYESGNSISELLNKYTEFKGERTVEVLRNVIEFQDAIKKDSTKSLLGLIDEQIAPSLSSKSATHSSLSNKSIYVGIGKFQLLYYLLKKSVIKRALKIKIRTSRHHPWNF
jgi:glycosyltransferase involved in cell wall biosynthesis